MLSKRFIKFFSLWSCGLITCRFYYFLKIMLAKKKEVSNNSFFSPNFVITKVDKYLWRRKAAVWVGVRQVIKTPWISKDVLVFEPTKPQRPDLPNPKDFRWKERNWIQNIKLENKSNCDHFCFIPVRIVNFLLLYLKY